jgi:RecA-family ATPase
MFTGYKVSVVILDGYAAAIDGDENTVSSVRNFFNCFLLPIIANNHVALIVTHHPRCNGAGTRGIDI